MGRGMCTGGGGMTKGIAEEPVAIVTGRAGSGLAPLTTQTLIPTYICASHTASYLASYLNARELQHQIIRRNC